MEQLLGQGLSLAEIGRRFGRHEATIGYWVKRYGLEAANHRKHVAKGGITQEVLKPLVDAGMSTADIAESVGLSKTTVRHWLREYGCHAEVEAGLVMLAREDSAGIQCGETLSRPG